MAFTTQYCYGMHEQRKIIPCSQKSFSCGLPCTKPLKCKNHKCIKTCHEGPCEVETDVCKQKCTKKRVHCIHDCNAPCHLTSECPDTSCRESIEVLCQCGLRKQSRTCHDFASDYRKIATAQLASSMEQMQYGGTIDLSDVLGPVRLSNNKTLECNEECRQAERNRRLAVGLQIRNPDTSSKFQPKYSEFIRSWAKKDPKLITTIHDKLTELVKLAKDSKQRSRSHSFPTMNREKRQVMCPLGLEILRGVKYHWICLIYFTVGSWDVRNVWRWISCLWCWTEPKCCGDGTTRHIVVAKLEYYTASTARKRTTPHSIAIDECMGHKTIDLYQQ